MISKNRIFKLSLSAVIACLALIGAYSRPWHPLVEIDLRPFLGKKVQVTIEKNNGDQRIMKFTPTGENPVFRLAATKIISLTQDHKEDSVQFRALGENRNLFLKPGTTPFPELYSQRTQPQILEACFLFALLVFFLTWTFLENARFTSTRPTQKLALGALHLSLTAAMYVSTFPGLFTFDSFDNFAGAARYYPSDFIGDLYFSFLSIGFQVFQDVHFLSLANAAVMFIALTILARIAVRFGVLKYYLLSLLIFFSYPVNFFISMTVTRDFACFWVFTATLILFYETLLTKELSLGRILALALGSVVCTFLRQESLLLPLGMIIISFFKFKPLMKPSALIVLSIIMLSKLLGISSTPEKAHYDYQATLLINPLSYILKELDPQKVHYDLGPYFKSEYLLIHQTDYEINPYHFGGLNPGATVEDYKRFRSQALSIFLEHPLLFLENRLVVSAYMLGLKKDWGYMIEDQYYVNSPFRSERYSQILKELGLEPKYRKPSITKWRNAIMDMFYIHKPYLSNFLIPILLILILLAYTRFRGLYPWICSVILARTLFVCLIAPAGYFKYLYPLWIFAPFSLFMVLAERKLQLTKAQETFKNPDSN